ncbi:MAG: phenylalanine--tRNA ligase subunit beta [Candidatus Melainabacteria bacterium]|nr:phenylalanine--tRNA ligase subunit beta [Candidatus Melainabacteria bacterium]
MKLSYEWLSEFVDLSGISPEEVAEKLTMNAFEVEDIQTVGANITGPLVVGKILEIHPVPKADRIRLTKVLLKEDGEPVQIVCGASNIEVGHIVPVALPGAIVINRKDGSPLPIKQSEIKGVTSNGMLCSPSELGLEGYDVDGILILSNLEQISIKGNGIKIGADAKEVLELSSDSVLNVGSRSNRGDGLSVIGLARELAALSGRPMKIHASDLSKHGRLMKADELFHLLSTRIENEEDCPLLTIRYIQGLKVGPSPREIVRRLEAIGVRSVNNIVDITNYVMHEMGQPLHAYDAGKLNGPLIQTRRAQAGETIITINEKEQKLTDEMLVIAGHDTVLGVAGVMGGKGTEISDDTTNIALEAAAFSPARVRRGSRLLGLSSDSSLRFERGVDIESVIAASDRASSLIMQYCSATKGSAAYLELATSGKGTVEKTVVTVRMPRVKKLLDIELTADAAGKLIEPLGFSTEAKGDQLSVKVPSFRSQDVTREIDVIEEIARIYGFDKLPSSMPTNTIPPQAPDQLLTRIKHSLTASGLSEAWISSLVRSESKKTDDNPHGLATLENQERLVAVLNPLSEDHEVLRQSLIPGLAQTAAYNYDHGNKDVFLFEVGRVYLKKDAKDLKQERGETGVEERTKVAGLLMGRRAASIWQSKPTAGPNDTARYETVAEEAHDYYRAKGVVEQLLAQAGVDLSRLKFFHSNRLPGCLHPFRASEIIWSKNPNVSADAAEAQVTRLGYVAELHPGFTDSLKFSERACVFELDIDQIRKLTVAPTFSPLASNQPLSRDLTADVDSGLDHASVESCIRSAAGGTLKQVDLVSLFQLADGKKSLSYRLLFLSDQEPLSADEVDKRLAKIRESLQSRLRASFRL